MDSLLEINRNLCRLCLAKSTKMHSLFRLDDVDSSAVSLSMKVAMCTTISVSRFDSLPKSICTTCHEFILEWFKFRRKSIKITAVLTAALKSSTTSASTTSVEILKSLISKPTLDETSDDDSIFNANYSVKDQPETCIVADSIKFKCNHCSESFRLLNELSLHKLTRHTKHWGRRKCKTTVESPAETQSPQTHLKSKPSLVKFEIKCCGSVYNNKYLYHLHRQLKHPSEKPFACDICGKRSFISEETLKRHKVLHSGQYSCNICGKCFTCNAILRIHVRDKHENDRPYVCDVCGKAYVTELLLSYHQRFHTGEKKFVCEECGVAVVTSSSLAKHKRIHNSIKPHICETCGKGFIVRGRLVEHVRIHTGERPFVCEICKKSFTMQDKLKRHIRGHLEQKSFSCEVCGRGYSTSHGLTIHLKTHSPRQQVTSNICHFLCRLIEVLVAL